MTSKADEMLEQQLKEAGKKLSRPSNSVDELLRVLDDSIDEAHQVAKEEACAEDVDPTVKNKSPKSVLSNRVNVTVMKDASVDQEPRKSEKDKSQEPISKEDTDDSHADKLVNEKSITEKTSKRSEKKADNDVKELENQKLGDNEVKKPENQNEEDNDVKEIENQNEADIDVKEPENKNEEDNDVKETENVSLLLLHMFKSFQQEAMVSKQQLAPQEDDTACLSKSGSLPGETRMKKVGLPKNKSLTQEDTPEAQNQAGKKMVISKEVKLPDTVNKSEDGVLCSDPDANLLKGSSKLTKRKLVDIMNQSEAKLLKKWSESTKQSVLPLNLAAKKSTLKKKVDVSGSDAKSLNMSVKKGEKSKITVEVEEEFNPDGKPLNLAASISTSKKKVEVSGSDVKSLKISVKKGEKSKIAVEEEEEYNSDSKRSGNGKNVAEKDQAKSLSGDDEMDTSSKSATKSAKGEGSSTKTLVTSAKRKHDTDKDEVTIKYDESLVGTKVKVWWPVDEMYYEGVVEKYYPDEKKHKISYVDGDTEVLSLKTQNWEILQEFSVRDYKGQNTKAQIEEASLEIHKEKKSKTHPSMSQEKIKDSANKFQKTMDTPSKYTLYTEEDMMTSFPAELRQKLFESVQVKPFNVRQAWSEVPLEEVLAVAPKKATLKELFLFTMLAGGALPANAVKIMNTIEEFIQTEMDDLANNIRVEEIVESDDKVIEVMGNEDAGVVKTSVTTCEADVNMDRSACKPSQIATDNLEHGLQFTLHGGMPISQPPQVEHPQHESQQQSQRQPHHQPFDVRHPSLPPCIEDVLHDHTHRLQKMENLIQWSVKLQIERARADGFPIPPLPSHSKDTLDPPL
ncbi:hypothetical protein SSX86_022053 [Deinandra increscens subsp. villosa]|uniref:Tudor domain-containing protein n=1 Tax=Deinandra increscens subsp. villosa TaxID=3103831 RepID=A0AAP0CRW7_9ASTR